MSQYNFFEDIPFAVYESVGNPTVNRKLSLPLGDIDLTDDLYVGNNGKVYAQDNLSTSEEPSVKLINNNTEEYSPVIVEEAPTTKRISKKEQQENAVYIMNNLIKRGFKPHEAAGIVGNLTVESGLNTGAYNPDDVGLPGGGLGGWRGSAFSRLKSFANSQGKSWKDIDSQIDYLVSTINEDVRQRLGKSSDPHSASEAWAHYEKYAGYDGKLSSAKSWQKKNKWNDAQTMKWIQSQHKSRSDYAKEVYSLWKKQNS